MIVQFGTDGKRINSTKIPSVPVSKNCVLKKPCTIENPILELSDFVPQYSVAYIPSFGNRYYFVNNIECVTNDVFRYYLTIDPLASHKNKVLANTVYVERSQSHGTNLLVDPYATHTAQNPNIYQRNYQIGSFNSSGFYVLQTAGSGVNTSIGQGVNTYMVSAATLRSLINELFTDSTYTSSGTTIGGTEKTYFNPFQYIISCKWFPIDSDIVSKSSTQNYIRFGWWTSTATAYLIKSETVRLYTEFMLPSLIDWTDTSPEYSRYSLQVPGIGSMEIDPSFAGMSLYSCIEVDLLTGGAKCEIRELTTSGTYSHTLDALLSVANGYYGVDVMLTQIASDSSNLASNAINSIASGMSGGKMSALDIFQGGISAGVKDMPNMTMGALASIPVVGSLFRNGMENLMQPSLSINGAVGNFSEFNNHSQLRLTIKHYNKLENSMATTNGLPYHRNVLLSTLSGFTRCNNASIPVDGATQSEKLAIKNYLEGGFWIE